MAKWKRKQYLLEPDVPETGEEFSPLGLSLLEHLLLVCQLLGSTCLENGHSVVPASSQNFQFCICTNLCLFFATLCLANQFQKLRAHLSRPLLWLHPRVVPTPQTFSNLLLLATLGGQVSTLPAKLSPSTANLAASPFQSHTLLTSLYV